MLRRFLLAGCLLCSFVPFGKAEDSEKTALQVIQSEGELSISDGSSYYTFKKDGTFNSGPCGVSRRTMAGSWRAPQDNGDKAVQFLIDAKIGWLNGMETPNDVRTITMRVYPMPKNASALPAEFPGNPKHFHECYFIIDEMKKKA